MTPQERQLVDDLFDRLSKVDSAPRDPDAAAAIAQGLRRAPNATYALVQTVLLQDEALKRAHERIEALEGGASQQQESGGFLDSMRDALFGQTQNQPRSSVPNVRPSDGPSRPVWNSGQVMPQSGAYNQGPYNQAPYGQPYGGQQSPVGGGGSFLGTAAAAAAGVVGGSLLLGSIRNMMGGMGGNHQSFGDSGAFSSVEDRRPLGNDSDLARDAGINDIGSGGHRADAESSRAGFFDQDSSASLDHDDMDLDSDDFGGDGGGGDYA